MKPKTVAAFFAASIIGVGFLRNGTATKATRQVGNLAQTLIGGGAKISRRI